MNPYIIPGIKHNYTIKPSLMDIAKIVCNELQIGVGQIKMKNRERQFTIPRHLFCKLASDCFKYGPTETGNFLERHQSSANHSKKTMQDLIDTDEYYKKLYERVKMKIC